MALETRTQRMAALAAAQAARATRRGAEVRAYFSGLGHPHGGGARVRAAVMASPGDWAVTAVACDDDPAVALLEHSSGLFCPVCGRKYDRIPGAGVGPVAAPVAG